MGEPKPAVESKVRPDACPDYEYNKKQEVAKNEISIMKYYIIAGEASGDLHGANLIKGLKKADPSAEFRFWGGDKMAEAGGSGNLVRHYRESAFMGYAEVISNIRTIFNQISSCKKDIHRYRPDVIILIDYAGFNLKIAEYAKKSGIKVFYYIAPKVWAWKEYRVRKLKKFVDRLFIIFPFEVEYFRRHGIEAIYEGNPLMDAIEAQRPELLPEAEFKRLNGLDERPLVALLAGSRKSEITYNLPFMVEVAARFPLYKFVVAGVSWLDRRLYDELLEGTDISMVQDRTYQLLSVSKAAIVTSGTATLETALLGTPEFVCYRKDAFSIGLIKMLVRIKYISLVNIILNREAVRELIQSDMTVDNAAAELQAILPGGSKEAQIKQDYAELSRLIGGPGASDRFAARVVEILSSSAEN